MHWASKTGACCTVFLVVASPIPSQGEPCSAQSIPIIVRDAHSLPIERITAQDFVVKVGGKSVGIVSIAADPRPRRAVILLDTSSSMDGTSSKQRKLPLDIALQVARSVSSNTQLAFLAFDDAVHDVIGFSHDNSTVLYQLSRMSGALSGKGIQRRTALYDAAYHGWQLMGNPSSADLLLAISDGGDNKSKVKLGVLERNLIGSGVRFFAVLVRDVSVPASARAPEENDGPRVLADIAEKTGGEVFGPVGFWLDGFIHFAFSNYDYSSQTFSNYDYSSQTKVEDALSWFFQGMRESEVLEIQLPAIPMEKESLEVKLSKAAAHRWKAATLSYPRRLLPCGQPR